jgi:hypothetical protein
MTPRIHLKSPQPPFAKGGQGRIFMVCGCLLEFQNCEEKRSFESSSPLWGED